MLAYQYLMKMSEIEISIKYNPENVEHLMTVARYLKATKMASALWDIRDLWRKYKHEPLTDEQWKIVDEYTERINDILSAGEINLDDLIN